jgi:hypothetical protein
MYSYYGNGNLKIFRTNMTTVTITLKYSLQQKALGFIIHICTQIPFGKALTASNFWYKHPYDCFTTNAVLWTRSLNKYLTKSLVQTAVLSCILVPTYQIVF